jgi:PHS family inorganic phosphate transporter-like MFS transporter
MIDLGNFNLRVWAVAASGFFTDSYNLFSTNVILPSLAFVYWTEDVSTWRETVINAMTLLGSIVGMILFGYLADKYGRTRLYGVELVIVIFSTIGVASCSTGFKDMNVLGWISVWRFVMGVGIGAEYPLSAVITAE